MGDVEFGTCDICGKKSDLQRKTFYYDIKCECHSPTHFISISHCSDCIPKEPKETRITLKTEDLGRLNLERRTKLEKLDDIHNRT